MLDGPDQLLNWRNLESTQPQDHQAPRQHISLLLIHFELGVLLPAATNILRMYFLNAIMVEWPMGKSMPS